MQNNPDCACQVRVICFSVAVDLTPKLKSSAAVFRTPKTGMTYCSSLGFAKSFGLLPAGGDEAWLELMLVTVGD